MRDRLIFLGPMLVIPLLVVVTMLRLEPPPPAPKIAFLASPTPTLTPTVTPTFTPTPTATPTPLPTATPTPAPTVAAGSGEPSFAADIQPLFNERCVKCHAGDNPPRGLELDTYEHVLKGGTYRAVVIPGDPDASEMVRRIKGDAIPRMPFDGPPFLDDEQIALIQAWIAAGAPDN